jgi:hypothetical protein
MGLIGHIGRNQRAQFVNDVLTRLAVENVVAQKHQGGRPTENPLENANELLEIEGGVQEKHH